MLAKTLAMEWADQGILVNTINPGYVEYVPRQVIPLHTDKQDGHERHSPYRPRGYAQG